MVLDTLAHWRRYEALHPAFRRAFEFLSHADWAELVPTSANPERHSVRHHIDGERMGRRPPRGASPLHRHPAGDRRTRRNWVEAARGMHATSRDVRCGAGRRLFQRPSGELAIAPRRSLCDLLPNRRACTPCRPGDNKEGHREDRRRVNHCLPLRTNRRARHRNHAVLLDRQRCEKQKNDYRAKRGPKSASHT